jgi:hypothetical protein
LQRTVGYIESNVVVDNNETVVMGKPVGVTCVCACLCYMGIRKIKHVVSCKSIYCVAVGGAVSSSTTQMDNPLSGTGAVRISGQLRQ